MPKKPNTSKAKSSASLGFEAKLWLTADKLRNNMDAAEYKHVVLGLIFTKYISDTSAEARWPHLQASANQIGIDRSWTTPWQPLSAATRAPVVFRFR